MRDYKNIDRIFQEKLKDLEVSPPNQSWNSIQKKLAPVSQKKRFPLWLKFSSVAALLLLFFSLGTIYFIPNNNFSNNSLKESNPENTVTDKRDKIDSKTSNTNITPKKTIAQPKINELINTESSTKITAINSIDEIKQQLLI